MATSAPAGNAAALQRLRPITTDFGNIVEDTIDDELARKKAAEDEAKAKAKAKADLANKFGKDFAALNDIVTKTKSIDEAFARGVNSARDLMGDIYKQAEQDPTVMNTMEWQRKKANLTNYSKNLKTVSDRYTQYADMIGKGMQDGSLSRWNQSTLNDLNSIYSQANLDVKTDQETGLPIAVIAEVDDNGKPTGKLKELNLVEILDGRGLNTAVNTFDFEESVTEMGTKLGKREVKTPGSGLTHIEYQKFEDIELEVRNMIKGFVGNAENPTDVAKSIWTDHMGEDAKTLTPEDMTRIEDFYTNSIKGFYDEKNKTTKDYSTGFRYSRAAREDEKEEGLGIQLRTDEEGRPMRQTLYGVKGVPQGNYFQFTIPEPIKLGIKGENREISNLMINDNGEIAYEEVIYRGKKSGEKIDPTKFDSATMSGQVRTSTSIGGGLNADEINDIARALGYRNAKELKDALVEASKQQGVEPSGGSIDTSKYN